MVYLNMKVVANKQFSNMTMENTVSWVVGQNSKKEDHFALSNFESYREKSILSFLFYFNFSIFGQGSK